MLKISEFSRLTHVPAKTLRYYDEIDLFKPAHVDAFTGYRYYSVEQLPRLHRILALKGLGFSLEQVAQLLTDDLTAEQIRGMLRLRRAETLDRLAMEQMRLADVESRLKQIEMEGHMPEYEVVLKSVESIRVAIKRGTAANMSVIGPAFERLFDAVGKQIGMNNAGFAGPGIALYYDEEYTGEHVQISAAFPTNGNVPDNDDEVAIETLPAFDTIAAVVHHGPFSEIQAPYEAIMRWIEGNGYEICGPNREVYLQFERGGDQANYVTEIQFPVRKR